jgi:hypothetical protein
MDYLKHFDIKIENQKQITHKDIKNFQTYILKLNSKTF